MESGTENCADPSKYRYIKPGEDNNEPFNWLSPKEFVQKYKESKYYQNVLTTIEDTNKELNPAGDIRESNVISYYIPYPRYNASCANFS